MFYYGNKFFPLSISFSSIFLLSNGHHFTLSYVDVVPLIIRILKDELAIFRANFFFSRGFKV